MSRALSIVLLTAFMMSGSLAGAASLEDETLRLEGLVRKSHATALDRVRLAQIYYMTSRCRDARATAQTVALYNDSARGIVCACGGNCDARSPFGKVARLRALLEKNMKWSSPAVQAAWHEAQGLAAAQYAVLRYLNSPEQVRALKGLPAASRLRAELESRLQSLEVKP